MTQIVGSCQSIARVALKFAPNTNKSSIYTDEGEILLDQELFNLLDKDEVAAIYLHEAIYKALRDRQLETDSVATRKIVATLMSDADDEQLTQVLKESLRSIYTAENLRKRLETMAYRFIDENDVAKLKQLFHAEYHLYGETIRLPSSTPRMLVDALYQENNRELVDLILDQAGSDFDINQVVSYGAYFDIRPFVIAVEWGDASIVKRLLEQFPDLNPTLKGEIGESPALQVIQRGRVEVLRVLLDDERIDPMKLLYNAIQYSYFSPRQERLEIFKLIVGNPRFDLRRRYESIWSYPLSRILSHMPESNAEGFQIAIEMTKSLLSHSQYDLFASGHGQKAAEEARKKGNIPLAELIETALKNPDRIEEANRTIYRYQSLKCDLLIDHRVESRFDLSQAQWKSTVVRPGTEKAMATFRFDDRKNLRKRVDLKFAMEFSSQSVPQIRITADVANYLKRRKLQKAGTAKFELGEKEGLQMGSSEFQVSKQLGLTVGSTSDYSLHCAAE